MKSLFALGIAVGFLWVAVEHGARMSSPAPSMYRTSGDGWVLIFICVVGEICVSFLP